MFGYNIVKDYSKLHISKLITVCSYKIVYDINKQDTISTILGELFLHPSIFFSILVESSG